MASLILNYSDETKQIFSFRKGVGKKKAEKLDVVLLKCDSFFQDLTKMF